MATPLLVHWYQSSRADLTSSVSSEPPVWPIPEDETAARKATLINLLLPAIQHNNRELLAKRQRLEKLHQNITAGRLPQGRELGWLTELSERYRLEVPSPLTPEWSRILLRRIDIIPADLALAQGALESAWGTSRFALDGNNYFGQWCFVKGCGLVPQQRREGANHEVARFSSPAESVRRYMHNLNSHPRYTELRLIREQARKESRQSTGSELAAGLEGYSEMGETYIEMVRSLIRFNELDRFEHF